jgi:hypothetical protein
MPDGSTNGTVAPPRSDTADERTQELARTLYRKVAQGFEVESEDETSAVLVMKGRRKWLGLAHSPSVRYQVSVDEGGRATSRRLSA